MVHCDETPTPSSFPTDAYEPASASPSAVPSQYPNLAPSAPPTATPAPSGAPTPTPTPPPTATPQPSATPSAAPSPLPSVMPTPPPSAQPTSAPTPLTRYRVCEQWSAPNPIDAALPSCRIAATSCDPLVDATVLCSDEDLWAPELEAMLALADGVVAS